MFERARFCGAVSVNTSSTQVRPGNSSRRKIILVNDGANPIYIFYQTGSPTTGDGVTPNYPTAVVSQGIRLNANGGSITEEDYNGPISAIASTAATVLTVMEL